MKDSLQRTPVDGIDKVLSVSKLRSDFKSFQSRRKLLSQHDRFLADDAVIPLLSPMLGKKFFEKKKSVLLSQDSQLVSHFKLNCRQPWPVSIVEKSSSNTFTLRKRFCDILATARDSTAFFLASGACLFVLIWFSFVYLSLTRTSQFCSICPTIDVARSDR